MKAALALARRGLGNVAPNPAVGCLIVKDDIVLGRGWTQPGGRPHAETEALLQAGARAKGATAYVTLEPCAHYGQTPPCAEALIAAGIKRVVAGIADSDTRVSGKGLELLQAAGIEVVEGILSADAASINAGFFSTVEKKRPLFTLKAAMSVDGKIATESGESKWITGAAARQYGHMLRVTHDAILVGVETVLADDPELTCRLPGLSAQSPIRIILDSHLRTPPTAKLLLNSKQVPLWIVANASVAASEKAKALSSAGADLVFVEDTRDLNSLGQILAERGLTRVLIEGGGTIHASFLQQDLCDVFHVFTAPKVIGNEGISGIGNLALAELVRAPHFKLTKHKAVGADLLATYRKAE